MRQGKWLKAIWLFYSIHKSIHNAPNAHNDQWKMHSGKCGRRPEFQGTRWSLQIIIKHRNSDEGVGEHGRLIYALNHDYQHWFNEKYSRNALWPRFSVRLFHLNSRFINAIHPAIHTVRNSHYSNWNALRVVGSLKKRSGTRVLTHVWLCNFAHDLSFKNNNVGVKNHEFRAWDANGELCPQSRKSHSQ